MVVSTVSGIAFWIICCVYSALFPGPLGSQTASNAYCLTPHPLWNVWAM